MSRMCFAINYYYSFSTLMVFIKCIFVIMDLSDS